MTKGARKSGGSRKRSQRRDFTRESRGRPEKTKILIVGEGQQTEPNYFRGLRRDPSVSPRFAITVKPGPGYSAEAVVKEAMRRKKDAESKGEWEAFEEVWCVLDVEGPDKRDSLDAAVALARREGISLCLSNPSFEVWFLSHFVRQARSYNDCGAVMADLNKHWQELCGRDYQKNDDQMYGRLRHLTGNAIANARWVRENHHGGTDMADANSSTEVYLLVRRLLEGAAPPQA
jgi:hypothetical protein